MFSGGKERVHWERMGNIFTGNFEQISRISTMSLLLTYDFKCRKFWWKPPAGLNGLSVIKRVIKESSCTWTFPKARNSFMVFWNMYDEAFLQEYLKAVAINYLC